MSRTYRTAKLSLDCNCGAPIGGRYVWAWHHILPTQEETEKELSKSQRKATAPQRCCRCWTNRKYDYSKRNRKRDFARQERSKLTMKKVYSRSRRAKVKQAMRNGNYDNIPKFRKSDEWDWN